MYFLLYRPLKSVLTTSVPWATFLVEHIFRRSESADDSEVKSEIIWWLPSAAQNSLRVVYSVSLCRLRGAEYLYTDKYLVSVIIIKKNLLASAVLLDSVRGYGFKKPWHLNFPFAAHAHYNMSPTLFRLCLKK